MNRPTRPASGLALLCAMATLSTSAQADTLTATRNQNLREVAHAVQLRVVDGVARFRVRRSFANYGKRHEEAVLGIVLPHGAAIVGLRIRGRDRWHDGELLEAEKARKLYRELTGLGPHKPRDPALLRWVWANEAELFLFPVPPKRTATVEYTLVAPTHYRGGRYHCDYPRATLPSSTGAAQRSRNRPLATPVLRVSPIEIGGKRYRRPVKVGGQLAAVGQPTLLSSPREAKVLRLLGVKLDPSASHVLSAITVHKRAKVGSLRIRAHIDHTYRGDLRVELVSPAGKRWPLHRQRGSSKNNVIIDKTLRFTPLAIAGRWQLHVSDHAGRDVGTLARWSLRFAVDGGLTLVAKDTPLPIPDAPASGRAVNTVRISVAAPPIKLFTARYGRAAASATKHFTRLELELAAQLAPHPKGLSAVFVVDGSRSLPEKHGLAAQLQLARAFAAHVPDAKLEIVIYRRRARRLFGRFIEATTLTQQLAAAAKRGALKLSNGSALDAGLKLGRELLAKRKAPRTLIASGDALLTPRWVNTRAQKALRGLPRGSTMHIAVLDGRSAGAVLRGRRDDGHALAPLAARHGGVLLEIDGLPNSDKQNERLLKQLALHLVRPTRIDQLRITPDLRRVAQSQTLHEGSGLRITRTVSKTPPSHFTIRGKLWARTIRRRLPTDRGFSRTTAAFVFSHDEHGGLKRAEMLKLAFFGRVVSPVTSYLAIEPGVRPSTAGLDRVGRGGGGGSGAGYGRGSGRLRGRHPYAYLATYVDPLFARCHKAHPVSVDWRSSLRLDLTRAEIVDIHTNARANALERCFVEALWRLELPRGSFYQLRKAYVLRLAGCPSGGRSGRCGVTVQ
jgi:subtilisin-like proprotein convertase family protein